MLTNKLSAARRVYTAVMRVLLLLAAVLTAALVVFMIVYVLYKGLPYVTWHLISTKPSYITGAIGILPDTIVSGKEITEDAKITAITPLWSILSGR